MRVGGARREAGRGGAGTWRCTGTLREPPGGRKLRGACVQVCEAPNGGPATWAQPRPPHGETHPWCRTSCLSRQLGSGASGSDGAGAVGLCRLGQFLSLPVPPLAGPRAGRPPSAGAPGTGREHGRPATPAVFLALRVSGAPLPVLLHPGNTGPCPALARPGALRSRTAASPDWEPCPAPSVRPSPLSPSWPPARRPHSGQRRGPLPASNAAFSPAVPPRTPRPASRRCRGVWSGCRFRSADAR